MYKDWYLYDAIEAFINSLDNPTLEKQEFEELSMWLSLLTWVWEE